jgi:hypothetical protein
MYRCGHFCPRSWAAGCPGVGGRQDGLQERPGLVSNVATDSITKLTNNMELRLLLLLLLLLLLFTSRYATCFTVSH